MARCSIGVSAVVLALTLAMATPVAARPPSPSAGATASGTAAADPNAAASAAQQARFLPVVQANSAAPAGTDIVGRSIAPDDEIISFIPWSSTGGTWLAQATVYDGDTSLGLSPAGTPFTLEEAGSVDTLTADFDPGTTNEDSGRDEVVAVSGRCGNPAASTGRGRVCLALYRNGTWTTANPTDLWTADPNGDPDGNAVSTSLGRVRLAAGDVDADGKPEIVLAYTAWMGSGQAPHVKLQVFDVASGDNWLVAGPSLDTGAVVDPGTGLGGGSLAVTAGDVDSGMGDGSVDPGDKQDDEIVLIWDQLEPGAKYHVMIQVFKVTGSGATGITSVAGPWDPTNGGWSGWQMTDVSITTGRFADPADVGPREQILFGWVNNYAARVTSVRMTGDKEDLQFAKDPDFTKVDNTTGLLKTIRVAAADLDRRDDEEHLASDGGALDEAIAAYTVRNVSAGTTAAVSVHRGLTTTAVADWTTYTFPRVALVENSQISLGVGRITPDLSDPGDARPQIIVSAGRNGAGAGWRKLHVLSFEPSPTPSLSLETSLDIMGGVAGLEEAAIAIGDVDGDGLRLGAPRSWTVSNVIRPAVIVKAVPTYFDVVGGQVYDPTHCYRPTDASQINNFAHCGFGAIYGTTQNSETKASFEVHADWAVSGEVSGGAKGFGVTVKASLKATAGGGFSRTSATSSMSEAKEQITARADDRILVQVIRYTVLEYPVYQGSGNDLVLSNYLKVIKPVGTPTFDWYDGADLPSWLSDDEPGNLLSYPAEKPTGPGWTNAWALGSGWSVTSSGAGADKSISWGDIQSAITKVSVAASIEASAEVSGEYLGFSASAKTSTKYDVGATADRTTTLGSATQETVQIASIEDDQSGASRNYTVTPYIRFDGVGAVVLDYLVRLDEAGPAQDPTFWDSVYKDSPDPSLTLPKRLDCAKAGAIGCNPNYETKSLWISDPQPEVGQVVDITARIRNYSLASSPSTSVRLFVGDPALGGTEIGVAKATGPIAAQGSSTVGPWKWTVPSSLRGLTKRIYAVVDPANTIAEVHEDNNKGWSGIMIQGSTSDVNRPTVALSATSVSASPAISVKVTGADTGGAGLCSFAVVSGTSAPSANSLSWLAYPPTTIALPTGDGTKTISAFSRDCAGNVSKPATRTVVLWLAAKSTRLGIVQENSKSVDYRGTFKRASLTNASGGHVAYASVKGRTAKWTATARTFAFVSTRGPDRGKATIWDGTRKLATINLYAATRQAGRIVWTKTFASVGKHTIKVVVTGTKSSRSSSRRVDIDAFLSAR